MAHTILVTGATGAIGRHVVDGLLTAGWAVRAVSRRPEVAVAALPGVEVVAADLGQPSTLDTALTPLPGWC